MQRLRQRPRCLLYNREPEGYYGTEACYVRHAWVVVGGEMSSYDGPSSLRAGFGALPRLS